MSEFWSAAFGAVVGVATGLGIEWWKSDREDLRDLCRELCELAGRASEAGTGFWLSQGDDANAQLLLARVIGLQTLLPGYVTVLIGRLDDESIDRIQSQMAVLFQELTGGDPGDPSRQPSLAKAKSLQEAANDFIICVRMASFMRLNFWERVGRFCSRSWVNRPQAMHLPADPFKNST